MRLLTPLLACLFLSHCAPECPAPEPVTKEMKTSVDYSKWGLTSFQGRILSAIEQPLLLPTLPSGFSVSRVSLSEFKGGPGSGPSLEVSYFKEPEQEFHIQCMSSGMGSLPAPEDPSKIKNIKTALGTYEVLPAKGQTSVWLDQGDPPRRMACNLTTQSLSVEEVELLLKRLSKL